MQHTQIDASGEDERIQFAEEEVIGGRRSGGFFDDVQIGPHEGVVGNARTGGGKKRQQRQEACQEPLHGCMASSTFLLG